MSLPLPDSNAEYGTHHYWEQRYAVEESYDWITSYAQVAELIAGAGVKKEDRILIVGCGNSPFSAAMYDDGYHNIVNIDYSAVVIEREKAKWARCENMQYLCMDMTNLEFDHGTSFSGVAADIVEISSPHCYGLTSYCVFL